MTSQNHKQPPQDQEKKNWKIPSQNQNQSQLSSYAKYSGLAFQMLAVFGLAAWGGMKLDEWMGNKFPFFLMFLILLAIFATILVIIKRLPKDPS